MANNKANSAKVLGYFNDLKQAKKGAMMSSYNNYMKSTGGEQQCGGPGKPRCRKKYGKRGGKLKKVLKAVGTAAGTAAATIGGIKLFKNFKDNGGF